jgi:hypothetical protein
LKITHSESGRWHAFRRFSHTRRGAKRHRFRSRYLRAELEKYC